MLGVNGVPGLLRARLFRAAVLVAASGVVIYLVLRGPGDTPGKIADAVGSACARDHGHLAVNDPYRNPGYFRRYYGHQFSAVVDGHAVRVVGASCEAAGGGTIYFKFDRPPALTTMNETLYLFALSLPALLDRIVADQAEARAPLFQPESSAHRE